MSFPTPNGGYATDHQDQVFRNPERWPPMAIDPARSGAMTSFIRPFEASKEPIG